MLTTLGLLLSFALPAPQSSVEVAPQLIQYEKQQLQERNRLNARQKRAEIVVPTEMFSEYKHLNIPAALLNRAFDPANHVSEGFHFDPVNVHKLDLTVTEPFLLERGIKEIIGAGVSNFYGSTDNRVQNIMTGLERYDGKIIPKDGTFSFNEMLDEIDEENGYAWAKTILAGKDRWGLGGGICQVSTNVFRAALNAGMPIKERRAHSYNLSKYSPAGLDATIYKGHQDLQFVNDTPGDVLIRVVRRENYLAVFFVGTRDRSVSLEKKSHWQGYDGRVATHWTRTIKKGGLTLTEDFGSQYSGSY